MVDSDRSKWIVCDDFWQRVRMNSVMGSQNCTADHTAAPVDAPDSILSVEIHRVFHERLTENPEDPRKKIRTAW